MTHPPHLNAVVPAASDRTKRRYVTALWTCGAAATLGVLMASCADTGGDAIVLGNDSDASATPSLTPSGADTAQEPDTNVLAMCNAYDCPAPYATCPGTSGLCTTNLNKDSLHCGSCDTECPQEQIQGHYAFFVCATGRCQMICTEGFADCNGLVDDGCEVSLTVDPRNCGACGVECAAGELCWEGGCGCPRGYSVCAGRCVRLSKDSANCGACGHACADEDPGEGPCGGEIPENTSFDCANSKCGHYCYSGYADCNRDLCGDGCETRLIDDPMNCGACGHACGPEQTCYDGKCLCDPETDPGGTFCDWQCTNLQVDPWNCGTCGNVCPGFVPGAIGPNSPQSGSPACVLGRCTYECAVGYGNCDGRIENGCETDLMVDPRNCGSCGTECDLAGSQPCAAGRCLTKPCDAGVIN